MRKIINVALLSIASLCLLSCEKEKVEVEEIDLSKVNVEVEFECIGEEVETLSYGDNYVYTILCTGKIGGFNDYAYIQIFHDLSLKLNESIVVAGDYTSFSFAFTLRSGERYYNEPINIEVKIRANNQTIFNSNAVIIL